MAVRLCRIEILSSRGGCSGVIPPARRVGVFNARDLARYCPSRPFGLSLNDDDSDKHGSGMALARQYGGRTALFKHGL